MCHKRTSVVSFDRPIAVAALWRGRACVRLGRVLGFTRAKKLWGSRIRIGELKRTHSCQNASRPAPANDMAPIRCDAPCLHGGWPDGPASGLNGRDLESMSVSGPVQGRDAVNSSTRRRQGRNRGSPQAPIRSTDQRSWSWSPSLEGHRGLLGRRRRCTGRRRLMGSGIRD